MKRMFAGLFACLLLLTATACGQADPDYRAGKAALEAGDYLTAYEHLSASKAPKAADLLEKLVFVPTSRTNGDGSARMTCTYNTLGNPLTMEHTFENSHGTATFAYDENNRLVSIISTGDLPQTVTFSYDRRGNLVAERYEQDDTVSEIKHTYNGRILCLSEKQTALSNGQTYTSITRYDRNGNTVYNQQSYSGGEWYEYTYAYDTNGNPTRSSSTSHDGSSVVAIYTYNKAGLLVESSNDNWKVSYTYDEAGRLMQKSDTAGVTYSYTYDENGNRETETYTCEDTILTTTYTYDRQGNKLSETYWDGTKKVFIYDDYGNKLTEEYHTDGKLKHSWNYTWTLHYYPDGVPEEVEQIRLENINDQSIM